MKKVYQFLKADSLFLLYCFFRGFHLEEFFSKQKVAISLVSLKMGSLERKREIEIERERHDSETSADGAIKEEYTSFQTMWNDFNRDSFLNQTRVWRMALENSVVLVLNSFTRLDPALDTNSSKCQIPVGRLVCHVLSRCGFDRLYVPLAEEISQEWS